MNDGGKGSKPRPFSVSQDEYDKRWDAIFQRDLPKEKTDYQDVLSTEDCALQALTDFAQEHGLYDMTIEDNPLIKK
jgi:hypothetical protein